MDISKNAKKRRRSNKNSVNNIRQKQQPKNNNTVPKVQLDNRYKSLSDYSDDDSSTCECIHECTCVKIPNKKDRTGSPAHNVALKASQLKPNDRKGVAENSTYVVSTGAVNSSARLNFHPRPQNSKISSTDNKFSRPSRPPPPKP